MKNLQTLCLDSLVGMHDAGQQSAQALPKLSEAALGAELKEALQAHLLQTENHDQLVEQFSGVVGRNLEPQSAKVRLVCSRRATFWGLDGDPEDGEEDEGDGIEASTMSSGRRTAR